MARMWTCGFELQSATALVEWQDSNGSPAISTTIHRAGTASLRITPAGATQYVEHQLTSGVVQRTFHRFYLYITTLPAADCNIYGIGQSGYFPGVVRLTTTGQLQLRDAQAAVNLGSPTAALSTGRWYRVELDFTDIAGTVTAGVSAFRGYLDGVQFADTLCSNINGFSRVRAGAIQAASALDICIDDIAVNDTSGTAQTGLPGPGCVVHLQAAGTGDNNGFETAVGGTAGAANNYTRVSEVTPNDATSYNQTTATGTATIDDFAVSSPTTAGIGASDTINVVAVGARIGSDATTAASIVTRIKGQASGTVSESASTSVAVNGWQTHRAAVPRLYQLTTYANPQTGTAWTRAALATAQIGYRSNVSQTTSRRVSTLWALVEYQPVTTAALGTATETSSAQPLAGRKSQALGAAGETSTGMAPGRAKTLAVGVAGETAAAAALGRAKSRVLAAVVQTDAAVPLASSKRLALGAAIEVSAAQGVQGGSVAPRPADALVAAVTGPVLSPGASGPELAASSSGPLLTATSSGGG